MLLVAPVVFPALTIQNISCEHGLYVFGFFSVLLFCPLIASLSPHIYN